MKKPNLPALAVAAAVAVFSAGCANEIGNMRRGPSYEDAANNLFVPTNYRAAETLLAQLQGRLPAGQTLIVATVVNIDALERSSTLGRLISEHVSSRFAQAGYRVIEMKFRNNVYMAQGQGELMLTREIREIASSHDAQAVVVGSYGQSNDLIFINLKVIQPYTNVALAVHDYALPLDANIRAMLTASRR